MKQPALLLFAALLLPACLGSDVFRAGRAATPTAAWQPVEFTTPTPTPEPLPTNTAVPLPTATPTNPPAPTPLPTHTPAPTPSPTLTPASVPATADTPTPALASPPSPQPEAAPTVDFVVRFVRMRTNEENSWDGTLGPGQCGNDHSIYVHVADAQENLLDGILVGDKYGNFEVPTGVDGPGAVRILVWSATMELAVVGNQDGARYTSQFTPPLSTLDEQIPLDWLEKAGYCKSQTDCQWRVENNQLCRGHYSYDVIFQRTW